MFDIESRGDLPRGEAGSAETGGDWAVGARAEGGEDSTVDGEFERARVGQEGKMPYVGISWHQFISLLYMFL